MSELDQALASLRGHAGVEHVLVLGRDGLLIQHSGDGDLDVETVSAMVPEIASAASGFGVAAERGEVSTVVMRFRDGVAVVDVLSSDLLLAVLLREGVGFAPLLRDLARDRARLASLV
ncbi:MAG TPA: roadblock/LC7 domain-containing protein [Longimicrobiaceae bacterium]|nr:roadblock/LC7 domain-containing protein [Longimicrobiaceae bacterium]